MAVMLNATYTGEDPLLKGHKALVKFPSDMATASSGKLLAQFTTVTMNGITRKAGDSAPFEMPVGTERYLYGWHEFAATDFAIERE
jgi:hypothetical protein